MTEIRWININMGCIETEHTSISIKSTFWININMGCIETLLSEILLSNHRDKH